MKNLGPTAYVIMAVIVAAVVFFGVQHFGGVKKIQQAAGKASVTSTKIVKLDGKKPFVVCINTWGGFGGAVLANKGFMPSKESIYWTKYGLPVQFHLEDNSEVTMAGFKSGIYNAVWTTIDMCPTQLNNLMPIGAKVFGQVDNSFGGDVVLVIPSIHSINQLAGHKIALVWPSPSSSLILTGLSAAGMDINQVTIIKSNSEPDAVNMFKTGDVDAVVCWSPDYLEGQKAVPGSYVLFDTRRHAPKAIADGFYITSATLDERFDDAKNFLKGMFIGNAMINGSSESRTEAAQLLAVGFGLSEGFCDTAIVNARLSTFGDNVEFFNLNGTSTGLTAEELYTSSYRMYKNNPYRDKDGQEEQLVPDQLPSWRLVSDLRVLQAIAKDGDLDGPEQAAHGKQHYSKPTPAMAHSEALSSKPLSITFASGSAMLNDEAKGIILHNFVSEAKKFEGCYIRVEGNTDNVGGYDYNKSLSLRRAHALGEYLISTFGWSSNRFIYVGNGPDNKVADNSTESGRALNRRTDFQFVPANDSQ